MAYETGAASGVADLLDKIRIFAQNNNWTIDKSETKELYLHKNDVGYFSISCDDRILTGWQITRYPAIFLYANTGFDEGMAVDKQPGGSHPAISTATAVADLQPPFIAYHFFSANNYIYIVIEVNAGEYAHFGFGIHEKTWQYNGGQFVYGTYYLTSYFSYLFDASLAQLPFFNGGNTNRPCLTNYQGEWLPMIGGLAINDAAYNANLWAGNVLSEDSPNAMNHIAPLLPIVNAVEKDGKTFIVGRATDVRSVNIAHIAPAEIVSYDADDWMCFPIKVKKNEEPTNSSDPTMWEYASFNNGIAYKKS